MHEKIAKINLKSLISFQKYPKCYVTMAYYVSRWSGGPNIADDSTSI